MSHSSQPEDLRSSVPDELVASEEPAEVTSSQSAYEPPRAVVTPRAKLEEAAQTFSQKHDQPSFTVLYGSAQRPLWAFVHSLGVRLDDVEDVVSLTGATLWKQRGTFCGSYDHFIAFGIGVARNKVLDWQRSDYRWNRTAILPADPEAPEVGSEDADEEATTPEEFAAAREALRMLAPMEREVLRLRAESHTWDAIAEALGIDEKRARRIHAAALERLRTER